MNEIITPNQKVIEVHNAFVANPNPTAKDVETYYQTMASTCLGERWKLVQALTNSAPAEKVASILKTVAHQSVDQQPTLLGTAIDIVTMSNGHEKGIIKLDAQGLSHSEA